jgi:hypothetical protein
LTKETRYLKPFRKLRDSSSKKDFESKECAKDIVSPSYNLRRKTKKLPGGHEGVHRGMVNFEGFQAKQSRRRVYAELYKECRRSSRIA